MSYGRQRSGLLVPHRFVTHGPHRIPLPENIHDRKMIACMAYDDNGKPFGDLLRVPRDLDIDMVDDSGKTLRHALHLRLMRKLEDSDGRFRYQDGDEADGITYIEEWPESENTPERWAKFYNRYHPARREIKER